METLEQINKEYNTFIEKRTLAINNFKELSKKTLQYIEELELMNLNKLLSSNSTFNNTSTLKCPYCEFIGTNVKSLAAHQRRCKNNKTIVLNEDSKIEIKSDDKQSETSEENKNTDETKYNCTICNNFSGMNNKSLSKHKQSCAKKHKLNEEIISDSKASDDDMEK